MTRAHGQLIRAEARATILGAIGRLALSLATAAGRLAVGLAVALALVLHALR